MHFLILHAKMSAVKTAHAALNENTVVPVYVKKSHITGLQ